MACCAFKAGEIERFVHEQPAELTAVVNLDGPSDLKATIPAQVSVCGLPVINDLFGGSPEERPERYSDASPVELLPFDVFQSFFGGRGLAAHVASYSEAVKHSGATLETSVLATATHFDFIDPQSDVWPQLMKSVRRLLSLPD